MKYPLIEKLGLRIHSEVTTKYVYASSLENLLQKATVVYGSLDHNPAEYGWSTHKTIGDTHKALLIAIEPTEEKKVTISRADLVNAFNKAVLGRGECIDHLIKELGL